MTSLQADLSRMESGEGGSNIQGASSSGKPTCIAISCGTVEWNTDYSGQITTTLAALSRLIDDYDSMARKEMNTAAREKAST